ncbi:MAG TPA: UbiA-like polyprenyltransferase [Gemmatimonadaceae bacterium]|jgi:4-hydroxybenzoate polyprenyltransferase|nr:UbiA-like polyprenyltransferase [Gemmatimonadaceae bacterium]
MSGVRESRVPSPESRSEGQTFAHRGSRLVAYVNFVKLPHTLFALPFALVGVILASYRAPVTWGAIGWIVLAFTCARFAAMGFNRVVDREIDAANPRTRQRELPSGALRLAEAVAAVSVASLLFVYAAWRLNPLCAVLSPVALSWVLFYSYTKRFTRWCHLVLGIGMSIAPVGGYLAIAGAWSDPWWMLIVLSLAVTTWGGGFDVLYALQDVEFDRGQGLHSLPAALGERRALAVARALHLLTVTCLALVGAATFAGSAGGSYYALGVGITAALLVYEHSLVKHDDFSRLDAAFFTMNGVISIVFFGCVLVERLVNATPALYAARYILAR